MEPQITEDTVTISPKTTYLRPEELVACRDTKTMPAPDNASTSQNESSTNGELTTLYSTLRLSISSARIERLCGRSLAIWDAEKCLARVVRKDGKFDTFGTTYDQQLYLEFFEALYLLESGRLQLEHHGRILSIEQAYLLLLGEPASKKFSEYFVYAYLTRTGYIVTRHKNTHFHQNTPPTEVDCIWAWLHNVVESKSVPNHIKKTQMYANIKHQMEANKSSIIEQRPEEEKVSIETPTCSTQHKAVQRKRKAEDTISNCNSKFVCTGGNSLVDFLTDEPKYKEFIDIFKKIDIIKLKSTRKATNDNRFDADDDNGFRGETGNSADNALAISFDLYMHNKGFKKSAPQPPLMRVIVLRSFENFPNHAQISTCSQNLLHTTPLLTVTVGDAKQFQAYLYYFS